MSMSSFLRAVARSLAKTAGEEFGSDAERREDA